jgi:DNA-directed RNA polymerase specialized sigma24 family protein
LPDPSPNLDELWEQQWQQEHLRYCVEQVRASVSEVNYRAFHMLVFEEATVQQVCSRLGMNPNQVYKAKSRVLQRVRQRLAELDSDAGE